MPYASLETQREYQKNWIASRRAEYFADKSCVRCDSTEALRLDHIDPGQKVSHRIWSWSTARREAELAKCQVLCETCHREKTAEDMVRLGLVSQHGSIRMYNVYGCRCDPCKRAKYDANKRYRVCTT